MGQVKTSSKDKHKKAIKTTLIALIICLIPTTFLYYVTTNYGESVHARDLDSPPFLMKQKDGGFFTNQSLVGKVTYFLYYPENCENCEKLLTETSEVYRWSKDALRKLEHFEESDVELQRVLVSSNNAVSTMFADWTVVPESDETLADLKHLSDACSISLGPLTLLFDRYGKIKACIPGKEYFHENVQRLMSKVTFNTSMDEYLSERTFFGPKKKSSEDIENGK